MTQKLLQIETRLGDPVGLQTYRPDKEFGPDKIVDLNSPSQDVAAGLFKANRKQTVFKYTAKPPGLKKIKLRLKNGLWRFQIKAVKVNATPPDDRVFARLRVGSVCLERSRECQPNKKGTTLKCR